MVKRVGVIDLGSNTTRLVIYEYEVGRYFRLADAVREVVRLREGMGNSNVLRAAAIDRSLNALRMFRSLADALGVEDVMLVATSAVRDAANSASFMARAEADTGWELRILSGEEEGYYGAIGAVNESGLREGFVIDLGGGSAQIVEIRKGLPQRAISLPLGALRLTEMFFGSEKVQEKDVGALQAFVREQLQTVDWYAARPGDRLVGIGGTIRNLAQVDQAKKRHPLDAIQGYTLQAEDLHAISDRLWRMSLSKRSGVRGLRYDRADIIHAGALTYNELLAAGGFDAITISRQGLREGVFYEHFLADQSVPIVAELREFSVLNLARNFECSNAHSEHVAFLAQRMFDDLLPAHQLAPEYRQILWAAGMLHDIGTIVDYQHHHQHSYYIIINYTLPGYSQRELALIALLCRYHRSKGTPKPGPLSDLMSTEDVRALKILAGIIRLAEFFERGRHSVIRDLRCHLDLDNGWLQIEVLAAGDAAMELWEAGRNLDVLADALELEVELVEGVWNAG